MRFHFAVTPSVVIASDDFKSTWFSFTFNVRHGRVFDVDAYRMNRKAGGPRDVRRAGCKATPGSAS